MLRIVLHSLLLLTSYSNDLPIMKREMDVYLQRFKRVAHVKIDPVPSAPMTARSPHPLNTYTFLNAYLKSTFDVLGDALTQAASALKNNESGSWRLLKRNVYSARYGARYFASTP